MRIRKKRHCRQLCKERTLETRKEVHVETSRITSQNRTKENVGDG